MIIYSIYKLVNTQTGKCYIGFTQNLDKRMQDHKTASAKKKNKLYNSVRKYGWHSFSCEIIYQSLDECYTKNVMENHFIDEYDSYRNGYNSTFGGEGNKAPKTQTTKLKMSAAKLGKTVVKDEFGNTYQIHKNDPRFISGELVGINKGNKPTQSTLDKLSISKIGNKNRLGIKHSEDIKKIISERTSLALKGKTKTTISCPHCGKIGGQGNMKRYHFDFCKFKNQPSTE